MKSLKLYSTTLLALFAIATVSVSANDYGLSQEKFNEIETRISSMNYDSLVATRAGLILNKKT